LSDFVSSVSIIIRGLVFKACLRYKEYYFCMLSFPWSPYTTKYYSLWHNKFVSGCLKKTLLWNYFVGGDWNSVLCLQKIQSCLIQEALGGWLICQYSVNLTGIGLDRCHIIEYSRLPILI
jgi:hypothetical protein